MKSLRFLLCIGQNMLFFVKNFSLKIARKASVYNGLSHFCVIITRASMRRTIPVAFIYTFLLKLQIVILLFVITGEICVNLQEKGFLLDFLFRVCLNVYINNRGVVYLWRKLMFMKIANLLHS